MLNQPSKILAILALIWLLAGSAPAAEKEIFKGAIPKAVTRLNLRPLGPLSATNNLRLSIGLPLHSRVALTNLLRDLYNPASPNFHHYLTRDKFTEKFGPTAEEYQAILNFAKTNGFTVTGTYHHRRMVTVLAALPAVEKAFHINLLSYEHPTEHRRFYAPDVEPSFDPSLDIQSIGGLNNYSRPQPMIHSMNGAGTPAGTRGTGPNGFLFGKDFRNAYAPGVTLNGDGQYIGLVEFDGYYPADITAYEVSNNFPKVGLINEVESGGSAAPDGDANGVSECSLDIEMAIAMAPGISGIVIFEGNSSYNVFGNGDFDDVLSAMADSPTISQFSSSWSGYGFDGYVGDNGNGDDSLQQMAAQGQSFFQASGDGDAYTESIAGPCDSPYVTSVGGTLLTLDNSKTNYSSETVWNNGFQVPAWGGNGSGTDNGTNGGWWGSGGGVSDNYGIPSWQQTLNQQQLVAAGGSTSSRNLPDVAMAAQNIWVIYNNGTNGSFEGTSCAAPLWAGFMALVNEKAYNENRPPVGFLNPALYNIGESAAYLNSFHDITTGDDAWPGSSGNYNAGTGYDLATGWGSPTGQGMIDALVTYSGQVWVDFSAPCPGNGSYTSPFCTLTAGLNAVSNNGALFILNGSFTPETPVVSKRMIIRAINGTAFIGN